MFEPLDLQAPVADAGHEGVAQHRLIEPVSPTTDVTAEAHRTYSLKLRPGGDLQNDPVGAGVVVVA